MNKLKSIYAGNNSLISVDASYCPLLTILDLSDQAILDVNSFNKNTIKSINLESCAALTSYEIYQSTLKTLM